MTALSKVYEPNPAWMRMLVRSSTREPVVALDDVTFNVATGRICAVIGANGAGKSTLFRILTGLTTPTEGHCRVLDMNPVTDAHRIRRHVGFMPAEDRTLFLRHTCRENLRFHGRLQGMEESALKWHIDEALETVGLSEARDRVGFALSSGMRARLMLARAILHQPRVLILDEPTGAVDPIGAHAFLELIVKLTVEREMATLISSHRLEEIDALRDNVLLLDNGRVVFWGDLDQVKAVAKRQTVAIECIDEAAAERVEHELTRRMGHQITFHRSDETIFAAGSHFGNGLGWLDDVGAMVRSVAVRQPSLRETISDLLRRQAEG